MIFKKLRCKHENVTTITNLYGDAINSFGGARSVRRCEDCGKIIYNQPLDPLCRRVNFIIERGDDNDSLQYAI